MGMIAQVWVFFRCLLNTNGPAVFSDPFRTLRPPSAIHPLQSLTKTEDRGSFGTSWEVGPVLNQTPQDLLVDGRGRPYFLWDVDMTVDEFRKALLDPDPCVRGYLIGKLMRQAKPDDVFLFVSLDVIRLQWPFIEKHLGETADFWRWILEGWERVEHAAG